MQAGGRCGDLARGIAQAVHPLTLHPVTARVAGNAIGLALEAHPLTAAGSEESFEDGGDQPEGRSGGQRDHAIVSVMVAVYGRGNEVLWSSPGGRRMNALEQLAGAIAGCEVVENASATIEMHLVDTVGAWIASTRTAEGLALLRFRAVMPVGRRAGDDPARSRDPLPARGWSDRRYSSRFHGHAERHRRSRRPHPGADDSAATADDVRGAILAGTEAMTRLGRAIDGPAIFIAASGRPILWRPRHRRCRAAVTARRTGHRQCAGARAHARSAGSGTSQHRHHRALARARPCRAQRPTRGAGGPAGIHVRPQPRRRSTPFPGVYGMTPDLTALTDGLGERVAYIEVRSSRGARRGRPWPRPRRSRRSSKPASLPRPCARSRCPCCRRT